jgi:hypothetical protein
MRIGVSQHATMMNSPVHQKQRLDILNAKCSMLQNLALNLCQDSLSSTSNNDPAKPAHAELKEEETVYQLKEPMDIEQQHSPLSDVVREEANSLHAFH